MQSIDISHDAHAQSLHKPYADMFISFMQAYARECACMCAHSSAVMIQCCGIIVNISQRDQYILAEMHAIIPYISTESILCKC